MLNSIKDIAISLGVTKMTIYRKLKVKMLKSHIIVKQGVQYLDDDGLTLLTKMLNPSRENVNTNVKSNVADDITNSEIATDTQDYINSLKSEIEFLRSESQEKNLQISDLNIRLSSEQELHKNTQILFKQQQPQDIKLLEEHFNDLDNKLIDIKDKMLERKDLNEKKSFFSKIFKNND